MKVFKSEEYIKMANPTPGQPYRPEILTKEHQAKNLGGMFGLLVAGSQVPYHYHNNRESVIIAISGEATEVIEARSFPSRPAMFCLFLRGRNIRRSTGPRRIFGIWNSSPIRPSAPISSK